MAKRRLWVFDGLGAPGVLVGVAAAVCSVGCAGEAGGEGSTNSNLDGAGDTSGAASNVAAESDTTVPSSMDPITLGPTDTPSLQPSSDPQGVQPAAQPVDSAPAENGASQASPTASPSEIGNSQPVSTAVSPPDTASDPSTIMMPSVPETPLGVSPNAEPSAGPDEPMGGTPGGSMGQPVSSAPGGMGADDDAGTAVSVDSDDAECVEYCTILDEWCTDRFTVYDSVEECMTVCAGLGHDGNIGNDSIACRLWHVTTNVVDQAPGGNLHCSHASEDSAGLCTGEASGGGMAGGAAGGGFGGAGGQ